MKDDEVVEKYVPWRDWTDMERKDLELRCMMVYVEKTAGSNTLRHLIEVERVKVFRATGKVR